MTVQAYRLGERGLRRQLGGGVVRDWQAASRLSFILAYAYLDSHLSADDGFGNELASERYNQGSPQQQLLLRTSNSLAEN